MKRFLSLVIIVFLLSLAAFAAKGDPYDLPVKKLYSLPDEDSMVVYNIPIEVKLLDISQDGNWYKVKISFVLGPLHYTYVGWAEIPVGEILAARSAKVAKTPLEEQEP
jgi:hypothetical protein